jgi:hypothetical protein
MREVEWKGRDMECGRGKKGGGGGKKGGGGMEGGNDRMGIRYTVNILL